NINEWKEKISNEFYCHAPTLHLFSLIYTNKHIVRSKNGNEDNFFSKSETLSTALEKIILANVYLISTEKLKNRSPNAILYCVILLKQFFYFYRKKEPKFHYNPFFDNPHTD